MGSSAALKRISCLDFAELEAGYLLAQRSSNKIIEQALFFFNRFFGTFSLLFNLFQLYILPWPRA